MPDDDGLSLDDIRAELTEVGRVVLDQATASAMRAKQYAAEIRQLRAEIARLTTSVPPAGEPGPDPAASAR